MPESMPAAGGAVSVSVVYASESEVHRVALSLPRGSTVRAALERSGLLQHYPQLSRAPLLVGIYGCRVALDTVLHDDDRIEIYRPLTLDPKEARRRKAAGRPPTAR